MGQSGCKTDIAIIKQETRIFNQLFESYTTPQELSFLASGRLRCQNRTLINTRVLPLYDIYFGGCSLHDSTMIAWINSWII
jgi:hypothetical protein